MAQESLEQKIQRYGDPVRMLRDARDTRLPWPYPPEWATWWDEQQAWRTTAALFDQSTHMTDVYFSGPDAKRLLSDTMINSPKNLGKGAAKQFVTVSYDGKFIGDCILFGLDDDRFVMVGNPNAPDWVSFIASRGDYDVEINRDNALFFHRHSTKRLYRYEIMGPRTRDIVEKAADGSFEHIKFFRTAQVDIAGASVTVFNHTMAGIPGEEYSGLELFGPAEDNDRVLDALLAAGAEFGMTRAGARSYISAASEGTWFAAPLPAIYSGDTMKPYREHLPATGMQANARVEGSFDADDVEEYYGYPWDYGYGNILKFDHDFVGREALEKVVDEPHREKVWLVWDDEDLSRVIADSLFGQGDPADRPKPIDLPNVAYGTPWFDAVLNGDRLVGLSTWGGYTVNLRHVSTVTTVDADQAVDGNQVVLLWGRSDGGAAQPYTRRHKQTAIRATIRTTSPVQ